MDVTSIEFRKGFPQVGDYSSDNETKKLLILDDLMRGKHFSKKNLALFGVLCHGKNIALP